MVVVDVVLVIEAVDTCVAVAVATFVAVALAAFVAVTVAAHVCVKVVDLVLVTNALDAGMDGAVAVIVRMLHHRPNSGNACCT